MLLHTQNQKECRGCYKNKYAKDNCRENVGIIDNTSASQLMNMNNISKANTSGVRGVARTKYGKYIAYVGFQRKLYHLGTFGSLAEAAEARRRAETELYGNFLEWYSKEYPEK